MYSRLKIVYSPLAMEAANETAQASFLYKDLGAGWISPETGSTSAWSKPTVEKNDRDARILRRSLLVSIIRLYSFYLLNSDHYYFKIWV